MLRLWFRLYGTFVCLLPCLLAASLEDNLQSHRTSGLKWTWPLSLRRAKAPKAGRCAGLLSEQDRTEMELWNSFLIQRPWQNCQQEGLAKDPVPRESLHSTHGLWNTDFFSASLAKAFRTTEELSAGTKETATSYLCRSHQGHTPSSYQDPRKDSLSYKVLTAVTWRQFK